MGPGRGNTQRPPRHHPHRGHHPDVLRPRHPRAAADPTPLTYDQARKLRGARPAGPPPRPRTEPITVQRRASNTGIIIMVAGQNRPRRDQCTHRRYPLTSPSTRSPSTSTTADAEPSARRSSRTRVVSAGSVSIPVRDRHTVSDAVGNVFRSHMTFVHHSRSDKGQCSQVCEGAQA
jgi:hypothetical protein